jgi:hypothetical protein
VPGRQQNTNAVWHRNHNCPGPGSAAASTCAFRRIVSMSFRGS